MINMESESSSLVHYLGVDRSEHCGYCKNGTMISHGLWAEILSAGDYQKLLDRGWRRSGKYCYKPINNITCCPSYTISCDAIKFKPDRSQRRCIKDVNNYLLYGSLPRKSDKGITSSIHDSKKQTHKSSSGPSFEDKKNSSSNLDCDKGVYDINDHQSNKQNLAVLDKVELARKLDSLKFSSKKRCKRAYRKILKVSNNQDCTTEEAYSMIIRKCKEKHERFLPKSLEDHLYPNNISKEPRHTLELRIHSVTSKECYATRDEELRLLQKYQLSIHKDDIDTWTMKRYAAFLITNPIMKSKIFPLGSNFSPDCRNDHNQSPVTRSPLPQDYGSYHCQYWLDGKKLIAVGVLDVLFSCTTSVYLYYDPEYSFLKLGIYSALHEIDMVRSFNKLNSSIAHYYMGFYIHSCPKMSYKIKYQPSLLLCPEANIFIDSHRCIEKLNESKYARFSTSDIDSGFIRPTVDDIKNMTILDGGSLITLAEFLESLKNLNLPIDSLVEAVLDYSQLVGSSLSSKMILGAQFLKQDYLPSKTG